MIMIMMMMMIIIIITIIIIIIIIALLLNSESITPDVCHGCSIHFLVSSNVIDNNKF